MRTVGRYRLVKTLGAGAFATVWLGHDDDLEMPVAVKILAENWARNGDIRERFLNEARLMRRISSPRVVSVHDVGTVEGNPYSVMDYLPGGTVADVMRGGLTVPEALQLALDSAEAVEALHAEGVLHRDLKPSNLMLREGLPDPYVVVTDLGTAKLAAEASGITMAAGTPAYMAPELVHGVDGFDQRADVYALGVLTYELLTSRKPVDVRTIEDVVRRTGNPTVAVADRLGLPPAVDELLGRTLSVDRERRPRSALEFGESLLAAVSGQPVDPAPAAPTSAQPPSSASSSSAPGAAPDASTSAATVSGDLFARPASSEPTLPSTEAATVQQSPMGAHSAAEPLAPAAAWGEAPAPSHRPSVLPVETPTPRGVSAWLVVPAAILLFLLTAGLGWLLF